LDEIAIDSQNHSPVIIAGDFNAWALEWGSTVTNARGRCLLEAFATLDLALLNQGCRHTFSRAGAGSIIDLTFVSSCLFSTSNWRIGDHYTASDHESILFSIGVSSRREGSLAPRDLSYKEDTLNCHTFAGMMSNVAFSGTAKNMSDQLSQLLKHACDASMVKSRPYK